MAPVIFQVGFMMMLSKLLITLKSLTKLYKKAIHFWMFLDLLDFSFDAPSSTKSNFIDKLFEIFYFDTQQKATLQDLTMVIEKDEDTAEESFTVEDILS